MEHFENWKDLLNPEFYIKLGGFWLVLLIVFAESGLFFGFFLPGDSLLFISGIYSTTIIQESLGSVGSDFWDTAMLASAIAIAAILGDSVGYWFGAKSGPMLYERKETFFSRKVICLKLKNFMRKMGHGRLLLLVSYLW